MVNSLCSSIWLAVVYKCIKLKEKKIGMARTLEIWSVCLFWCFLTTVLCDTPWFRCDFSSHDGWHLDSNLDYHEMDYVKNDLKWHLGFFSSFQDNTILFLRGCKELGLKESQLFDPSDLQDTSNRATVKWVMPGLCLKETLDVWIRSFERMLQVLRGRRLHIPKKIKMHKQQSDFRSRTQCLLLCAELRFWANVVFQVNIEAEFWRRENGK